MALSVPDLTTDAQVCSLPRSLTSLEMSKSTSNAGRLQLISQQCPHLQQVRIGYSLVPSRTNAGSRLLDHALNGWVLLPLVEMRFIRCRLPRYGPELPYNTLSQNTACSILRAGVLT
jgi:hypothetical protein